MPRRCPGGAPGGALEDDPRSAHGRIVDPVQLPEELPEGWRQSARNESDGPPKPAKPRMPIKPDENVHDWDREHHKWFEGEDISREDSKAALDAMIDRIRIEDSWGKLPDTEADSDQSKGGDNPSANGPAADINNAVEDEADTLKSKSDIGPFEVPSDPEDVKKLMRSQGIDPDADFEKGDRITPDELERIVTNRGMSGVEKFLYFVGPDGYLYHRTGNRSYIDPQATKLVAREMMMVHAAKFDVPWDDVLLDGAGIESGLDSRPVPPGSLRR